jgi:hypothetical protein
MKKLLLNIMIMVCFQQVWADEYKPFYAQFNSTEDTTINGTFYIHGYIYCLDTISLLDTISYLLPNGWSEIEYQNNSPNSESSLYLPGDSIPFVFSISYPTSGLPYYPKDVKIFMQVKSKLNDTLNVRFHGRIFFTPWNSVEIWAEEDFYSIGRVWKEEILHGSLARVSIDRDSVPVSDIGPNDTITEDWQYEARLVTYPGLPFYVKMKPVHPDTMKYYAENFGDSASSLSNRLNKADFRYIGNISGTISTAFTNDLNNTNPLFLKGVLIKLIDRDGPNGNVIDELDETHTDENGNFTLSYNVWQPFERGELELELHIKAKNKDYKFEVINKGGGRVLFGITEELAPIELGKVGHNFTQHNLELSTENNAFKVCNWAFNAFHYCETQGILSKVLPVDKKLHIATNFIFKNTTSSTLPNTINLIDFFHVGIDFSNPTIFLKDADDEHENTFYHEWGHFMMWCMQDRNFITRLDKSQCFF